MAWEYCTKSFSSYISARASANALRMIKEESKMAIRFCSIVFTDIFCWFPIAILIYISLTRIVSDKEVKLTIGFQYVWPPLIL